MAKKKTKPVDKPVELVETEAIIKPEAIVEPQVEEKPISEEMDINPIEENKKQKKEKHHGKVWCVLPQYGSVVVLDDKDGKYYTIPNKRYEKDQEIDF